MQERLIENEAHKFYKDYDSDPTLKDQVTPCGFLDLLHFADKFDMLLMFFGSLFAIGSGVSLIFYSGPLAQMIAALAPDKDLNQVVENAWIAVKGLALNSVIVFLNCWFMSAAWTVSAERQVNKARKAYFQALLQQEVTWHDRKKPQETCSKMYMHISGLQTALVTNVTGLLSQLSIGVAGLVMSFIRGWQMSLVMMSFLPIMIISGVLSSKAHQKFSKFNNKNLPIADGNVSEVFEHLKTVKYLNGEQHEIGMFQRSIDRISRFTLTHERLPAVCTGLFMLCLFLNYSVGFWYGSKMVTSEEHSNYTASDVLIIFGVLYLSNLNIICIPDSITNFLISRVAMTHILNIVNRVPKSISGTKPCPSDITSIEFKDVMFQFDKPLFDGLNITISKGIVALIGESGSGKTTLVNLICKFYEPFRGQIILHTLKGQKELKEVKVNSLMEKIGYVGQEPVLIGKTIREVLGAEQLTNEEIMEALEIAQAASFVVEIGLDQEFGALSGGQKQRIAIARALCRKPQILILDEGTSALDRLNEQLIFKNLRKSKTIHFIIMVAHRMETVRNADLIFSVDKGKIRGSGTYAQLVNRGLIKDTLQKISHEAQQQGEQQKQEELEFEPQQSKKPPEEAPELVFRFSYIRSLLRYNQRYCSVYIIGLICSAVNGTAFPLFSYVISQIISILSSVQYEDSSALPALRERSNNLSLLLFGVSITMFLVISVRCLIMNFIREKLGVFLKKKSFKYLIHKKMIEVQKFGTRNTADIVISSTNGMKELIGNHIGNLCENIATLGSGLAIAFYFSWQIALLSLGIFPLIILAGKAQMDLRYGMMSRTGDNHKNIHTTVVDTIVNIRTIKSLSLEAKTVSRYEDSLNQSLKLACKYGNLSGIALGIGQALTSILFAIIFYVGALFVRDKYITVLDLYTSVNAIMFSGIQAGIGINFINGLARGKVEAARYFSQVPEEDDEQDQKVTSPEQKKSLHGPIVIKDLCFRYPIKNESVFEHFNLTIEQNEKIAFVGESGSGKSTLANLLLMVYEPDSGSISIGGHDYKNLLKEEISKTFAIVSQQPVLFNRSVGDNIKYNTNADLQQVVEATKKTNAYDFIMEGNFGLEKKSDNNENEADQLSENSLGKEKYHELVNDSDDVEGRFKKNVGPKGSHLSGGQKQRVAIARALVRNPKVIVFDEATSALDTNNEVLIQETLSALPHTTQIIIAHRLSTIKECDRIVVLGAGKVLEMGKYDELLQKEGHFYRLVNALRQKE